ncbi:hypothetical protein Taro_043557 [Colocasia esculenta]|uniref:Uncharacterized protein n=1 Tax=Colocasia esculenta TaxID=4460 RepID=A0A843WZ48_COLES|nr:hypothetical protein [Colocasia esculenta]
MVRGGCSGRGSTSFGAPSTSVGRGVRLPTDYAGCPGDKVRLPADYVGCPGDRVHLPADYAGCPDDRVRLSPSSVTCPILFSSRGKIDPGPASCYITTLLHAHVPGPVDSWKEFPSSVQDLLFDMFTRYMFTRPEDLP